MRRLERGYLFALSIICLLSWKMVLVGCGKKVTGVANEAPRADAGPDRTVTVYDVVILDGKGSDDPDGDVLTYRWMQDPDNPEDLILAYNAEWGDDPNAMSRRMFIPTVPGVYTFELVVSDGRAGSEPDRVVITVTGQTAPPLGMVRIPAGEFIMGSDYGEDDERPVRTVFLDAYFIDIYEVTNAQYEKFVADNPDIPRPRGWGWKERFGRPDHPVIGVNWEDAQAYCKWADKRLPTEAEWEKAARGTDGREWPWGNEFNADIGGVTFHANIKGSEDGYEYAAPVGGFPTGVSPYGVHDMAGNAKEWVQDYYAPDYYSYSPVYNPKGPDPSALTDIIVVVRGGDYFSVGPDWARSARRDRTSPGARGTMIGFRCAKDVK